MVLWTTTTVSRMPTKTPRPRPSKGFLVFQLVLAVSLVYLAIVAVTEDRGPLPPFLDTVFLLLAVGLLLAALWNLYKQRRSSRALPPQP